METMESIFQTIDKIDIPLAVMNKSRSGKWEPLIEKLKNLDHSQAMYINESAAILYGAS